MTVLATRPLAAFSSACVPAHTASPAALPMTNWQALRNLTVFGAAPAWRGAEVPSGARITNIPSGRSTDTYLESWCAGPARCTA